jgi:putative Holliday junction resolvase
MTAPGRLIGLDLGRVRIGVAVSDSERTIATGVAVVARRGDLVAEHAEIVGYVDEYGATGVVVGVPYSMSGSVGPAAAAALEEIGWLSERVAVPVMPADERLTTVAASGALRAGGKKTKAQRGVIDQTAAAVILQSFIDGARSGQGLQ